MSSFRRNKRGASNCPTCGIFLSQGYRHMDRSRWPAEVREHRCDPKFLAKSERSVDVAFGRDVDGEPSQEYRGLNARLSEGFRMLDDDDDGDDD